MNAKSTTSRIALTMFCAGALSLGMAPAAMASDGPVSKETGNTAVVQQAEYEWYETVTDVVRGLTFTASDHSGKEGSTLTVVNGSGHSLAVTVTPAHGHRGTTDRPMNGQIAHGPHEFNVPNGGIKQWTTEITQIDRVDLPTPITVTVDKDGVVVTGPTDARAHEVAHEIVEKVTPDPEPEAPAASSVPVNTAGRDKTPVAVPPAGVVNVPVPVQPSEDAVAPVAVPGGAAGGDEVPVPVPPQEGGESPSLPVLGGRVTPVDATHVSVTNFSNLPMTVTQQAARPGGGMVDHLWGQVAPGQSVVVPVPPRISLDQAPGAPVQLRLTDPSGNQLGLVRPQPDGGVRVGSRVGDVTPQMSQGVTFPAPQGVTGGDQVPVPVPPSEDAVDPVAVPSGAAGGDEVPVPVPPAQEAVAPVAVPSGVAGGDDVPMPVPTPNTEGRDSKPELPAFALTPATVSVPATALTPANTISIPVEVPAKVTTTARPESAKPARSNARTEVKNTAGAPDDTAAQLAHTGADETAALAALALALMGTGITLVGLKRRQTA